MRLVVCLAGLVVLALAGCDGTISVTFRTGPQELEVSTASFMLPIELRDDEGLIDSVPCGPMGMCPPTDTVTITCEADLCDPAPKTLSAPVGGVLDVDVLLAETAEIGITSVEVYEFGPVDYEISLNTLTVPLDEVEIFWGPEAATAIDPALGVRLFGTLPATDARQVGAGQMLVDSAGAAALSDYLTGTASRVRFFARTVVDLDPGDPFPEGSIRLSVNLTVRATGSFVD